MRILVAEDDFTSLKILESVLKKWGYEVVSAHDGLEAWEVLKTPDAPRLAILDWMMPSMEGVEVCRKLRQLETRVPPYIILLTSRAEKEDIVAGLSAGANDYIEKPFDSNELQARIKVGVEYVKLQLSLVAKIDELETALAEIKTLQGFLPICSCCKKIRNDQNYWEQIEVYLSERMDTVFSHGLCPVCEKKVLEQELKRIDKLKA